MTTTIDAANVWRPILETALDAVVVMDRKGNVIDWNDNATSIFGWNRDDLVGRLMADFIVPPHLRDAHANGLKRYLSTGKAHVLGRRIEITALRRSGEEFPVELSISPLKNENGLFFLGFLRDISERRSLERLREQHTRKMEALYETISFAAEHDSIDEALAVCLASVQKLTGWPVGQVFLPSGTQPERLLPSPVWHSEKPDEFSKLRAISQVMVFAPGEGLPGRIWTTQEPQWIADVGNDPDFPRAHWPGGIEIRAALGFPILARDKVIAVVEFFSEEIIQPDLELLRTLRAMGEQVGRVFERRLAEESMKQHALALEAEVEERKKAEAQQRLLIAEVNHRVKNMLAVVTAIAGQTGKHSATIEAFRHSFSQRLGALSTAHSLITLRNWEVTSLLELAEQVLAPFRASPERLQLFGPVVMIPPKAVLGVSMVLHELVTNALKYGGLAVPGGSVVVNWTVEEVPIRVLRMRWRESGVGPVSPPDRLGFGSKMIQASVQHDLKGSLDIVFGIDGIQYDFHLPLSA